MTLKYMYNQLGLALAIIKNLDVLTDGQTYKHGEKHTDQNAQPYTHGEGERDLRQAPTSGSMQLPPTAS